MGVEDRETSLRVFGLREIGAGIGILASPKPKAGWLWARVAGDALDLGAISAGLAAKGTRKNSLTFALVSVLCITLLDLYCAVELGKEA